MAKSVFCIADNYDQVQNIVGQLRTAGFSANDISVLFPDKKTTKEFAHEKSTKAPEGAVAGAGAGAVLGGAAGLLVGIGALAIPGLGPLIAAGPIMAALSGIAAGGALGGLTGALIGMGIPELEAKRYETRVKGGDILVSVNCEDGAQASQAAKIFEDAGAQDISSAAESNAPSKRRSA